MEQGFFLPSSLARMPRESGALQGRSPAGLPLAPWVSAPPPSPLQLAAASVGGSGGLYAGKKRKKPLIRSPKSDVVVPKKTNPSKRHRDRLNAEMERLAGMLPFPADIISKLDKLSILRLSVSFLRTKSFFTAVNHKRHLSNGLVGYGVPSNRADVPVAFPEGEMLLQALHGFVLVVTADGLVFYTSHTIQEYLGFHQCDVVHQSVYELIHTEDRYEFRRQLHWALNPPSGPDARADNQDGRPAVEQGTGAVTTFHPQQLPPENSSFLERQFMCRFRCLLDNSSGFLALLIQGRLKLLHGQNQRGSDGSQTPPQLALFCVATPLQPPSILEIRTRNTIFRTKHKLDFTPTGCDAKGRIVLGYSEIELCMRGTGYQFIHTGDMLYCADNHVRMMKTGESGFTIFRLLTKDNGWAWVQANARLVYKGNRPDYIIATQRPLSNEEGEEHLRKRATQFPFAFTTGEALLYNTDVFQMPMQDPGGGGGSGFGGTEPAAGGPAGDASQAAGKPCRVNPSSLVAAMMLQNKSVSVRMAAASEERLPSYTFNDASWLASSSGRDADFDRCLSRIKLEESDGRPGGGGAPGYPAASARDELADILDTLGVNMNDIELVEEERQLIMGDMEASPHLGNILSNDDIIAFVEDLLTKPDCCVASCQDGNAGARESPQLANPLVARAPDFFAVGGDAPQSRARKAPMHVAMPEARDVHDNFLACNFFNGGNVGPPVVALQGTSNAPIGVPLSGAVPGTPARWNASAAPTQGAAHAHAGYAGDQPPLGGKLCNWSPTAQAAFQEQQQCRVAAMSDCNRVRQDPAPTHGIGGPCGAAGPPLANDARGLAHQGPLAGLPGHGYAGGVADFVVAEPAPPPFRAPHQGLAPAGLSQSGLPGLGWPAHLQQRVPGAGACPAPVGNGDPWALAPAPPYSPMAVDGAQPPHYADCVSQMHALPFGAGMPGRHPDPGFVAHFHHHQQQPLTQPVAATFDLMSDLAPCHPNGHEGFLEVPEGLPSFPDILRTGRYS